MQNATTKFRYASHGCDINNDSDGQSIRSSIAQVSACIGFREPQWYVEKLLYGIGEERVEELGECQGEYMREVRGN